jgi:hypothetical protein
MNDDQLRTNGEKCVKIDLQWLILYLIYTSKALIFSVARYLLPILRIVQ